MGLLATFGTAVVAAFGVVTRVEGLALMVLIALSSGLSPIVGQNFGAKLFDRVQQAINIAYKFSVLYGIASAVLLFVFATPVVLAFRDDPEVVDAAVLYLQLVPISFILVGIGMTSSSIFVAYGEALPSWVASLLRSVVLLFPLAYVLHLFFDYVGVFAAVAITNMVAGALSYVWLKRNTSKHRDATHSAEVHSVSAVNELQNR